MQDLNIKLPKKNSKRVGKKMTTLEFKSPLFAMRPFFLASLIL